MIKQKQDWKDKLVESGNRLTKPREVIFEVLDSNSEHLSAEDIYLKIHKKNPNIGLTTVYRTLDMFFSFGIVDKFDFGDDRARFELNEKYNNKRHHHHLVCNICKKIFDYADFTKEEVKLCKLSELYLSKKFKFRMETHVIQFYGVCSNCRKKESK
jgi:Fur family transcriptional regulator, ferric uptake regulator